MSNVFPEPLSPAIPKISPLEIENDTEETSDWFPVFFSPHNSKKMYAFSNHVHVTENEGQSWEIISPDLTRNVPNKLKSSGGPITQDNTGVEYYCTLFAGGESNIKNGLIWVGSDDGLIHITKDGGESWENITPPNKLSPELNMISSIDPSPFKKGKAYVAATSYKFGDYTCLLYTSPSPRDRG